MKKEDEQNKPAEDPTSSVASKVNLDDYAGDADDDHAAKEQSNKYRNDLDRPNSPTQPGKNEEG